MDYSLLTAGQMLRLEMAKCLAGDSKYVVDAKKTAADAIALAAAIETGQLPDTEKPADDRPYQPRLGEVIARLGDSAPPDHVWVAVITVSSVGAVEWKELSVLPSGDGEPVELIAGPAAEALMSAVTLDTRRLFVDGLLAVSEA